MNVKDLPDTSPVEHDQVAGDEHGEQCIQQVQSFLAGLHACQLQAPFTRYNLLTTGCIVYTTFNRLSNPFDNRFANGCIVYTAGLNELLFVHHGCQTGFDNRLKE